MSPKSKVQSPKLRNIIFICLLLTAVCQLNCSIPNLETPECSEARNTVKEFYSYHFGNDMKFTKENLKPGEKFLSNELKQKLASQSDSATDYFTATDDYPKAFRVGSCETVEPNEKVNIQIVLFWKTESRSEQREVRVEVIRENENWLVNKVESK